ncbi:MAG: ABC transporter substrate-binding protein [Alphaproteobacteria bacterium]|jgi:iron(III) transport system substrate-binding protein
MKQVNAILGTALIVSAAMLSVLSYSAGAADLPKSTQKIIAKLNLPPALLKGLEEEAKMPAKMLAAAKKEKGRLKIGGTWDADQFRNLIAPFKERFPFIDVRYGRATRHDRVIKPLIAFQNGRIINDIISGVGAKFVLFRNLNAIEDLSSVPNWKNVPKGMKHPKGLWIGQRLRYWCMSYNTDRVKKAELPKTWDDLITNKRWHNKKIGLGNRPNLWLIGLWGTKGRKWATQYARDLLNVVNPQLRKEGMNALIGLTVAGEFDAALPSAAYRTGQMIQKGAPVSWHCPEPVPLSISEMVVMRGSKHKNSALMFINWFLSKEGQISQFASNLAPPVHRDLQTKEFLTFPDQIIGKKIAFRDPEVLESDLPKLLRIWDPLWFSGRGMKLVTVASTITKLKRGARRVVFTVKGKSHTVKVSGSRTEVSVKGKEAGRKQLKVGMKCEFTYPGDKEEAKRINCK